MNRVKHPPKRDCMVIADYPIKMELDNNRFFSSVTHLELIDKLQKAGIKKSNCFYTYLSMERPDKEDNPDFINDFAKEKDLFTQLTEERKVITVNENGKEFFCIDEEKKLYISKQLAEQVNAVFIEIEKVKPKLVILMGKWSLFFLCNEISYTNTRSTKKTYKPFGSLLTHRASVMPLADNKRIKRDTVVIPILPIIAGQRMPQKKPIIYWDIKKCGEIYKDLKATSNFSKYIRTSYNFTISLDYNVIIAGLIKIAKKLQTNSCLVSVDIETKHSIIDCFSITLNTDYTLWVPLATEFDPNIWSLEQETIIIYYSKYILQHPNSIIIGQNFSYDAQYFFRDYLIKTIANLDSMIMQHVLYNTMPKSLDFLASVFIPNYTYWKGMQTHEK